MMYIAVDSSTRAIVRRSSKNPTQYDLANFEIFTNSTTWGEYTHVDAFGVPYVYYDDPDNVEGTPTGHQELRRMAYKQEAYHLFIDWQIEQTPASETLYLDKLAEIELIYPP